MTQHQAKRDNLSGCIYNITQCNTNLTTDVSAKDGSQETAVNLLGLGIGFVLTPFLVSQTIIWCLFAVFTFFHLLFNYFAVRSVIMETFNQSRASILMQHYFDSDTKAILTPEECNKKESVLQ